jgi:dedicator of cytokinesis protein 3
MPEANEDHPALRAGVISNIQAYWRSNGIKRFTTSRPFLKDAGSSKPGGPKGDGTGILTWTEKTILISELYAIRWGWMGLIV